MSKYLAYSSTVCFSIAVLVALSSSIYNIYYIGKYLNFVQFVFHCLIQIGMIESEGLVEIKTDTGSQLISTDVSSIYVNRLG